MATLINGIHEEALINSLAGLGGLLPYVALKLSSKGTSLARKPRELLEPAPEIHVASAAGQLIWGR